MFFRYAAILNEPETFNVASRASHPHATLVPHYDSTFCSPAGKQKLFPAFSMEVIIDYIIFHNCNNEVKFLRLESTRSVD